MNFVEHWNNLVFDIFAMLFVLVFQWYAPLIDVSSHELKKKIDQGFDFYFFTFLPGLEVSMILGGGVIAIWTTLATVVAMNYAVILFILWIAVLCSCMSIIFINQRYFVNALIRLLDKK